MNSPDTIRVSDPELCSFRDIISDAIRYWEPKRLVYNIVLALVFLIHLLRHGSSAAHVFLAIDAWFLLFILVVLANICYSTAYVLDVFVQWSSFRKQWISRRWILFAIGLALAVIITRFVAMCFFRPVID